MPENDASVNPNRENAIDVLSNALSDCVRTLEETLEIVRMKANATAILNHESWSSNTFVQLGIVDLESLEIAYIRFALRRCEGNKTQAAEALGIDPSTLHRKLSKWSERSAQSL